MYGDGRSRDTGRGAGGLSVSNALVYFDELYGFGEWSSTCERFVVRDLGQGGEDEPTTHPPVYAHMLAEYDK